MERAGTLTFSVGFKDIVQGQGLYLKVQDQGQKAWPTRPVPRTKIWPTRRRPVTFLLCTNDILTTGNSLFKPKLLGMNYKKTKIVLSALFQKKLAEYTCIAIQWTNAVPRIASKAKAKNSSSRPRTWNRRLRPMPYCPRRASRSMAWFLGLRHWTADDDYENISGQISFSSWVSPPTHAVQ